MKINNIKTIKVGGESFCFRCGESFGPDRKRTGHHALPLFMKPCFNVEVPICEECHKEMNSHYVHALPKLRNVKLNIIYNRIEGLDKSLESYQKRLNKFKEEIAKLREPENGQPTT